ncbi:unannotated protein [freshwater metagenome]|uniref:Unannotated protein n=1 Tax=freshwater metagenome TaxID=449393 RepID=A0A6J6FAA4_9ZZZZ
MQWRVGTKFAAESRLLEPTERGVVPNGGVRIDREIATFDRTRNADSAPHITGPNRAREPELRRVRDGNRVGLILERVHGDNRSENLVRHARVIESAGQRNGRSEPVARPVRRTSAEGDISFVQIGTYRFEVLRVNKWANLGRILCRVTDDHPLDRGFELFHEFIEDRLLNKDSTACTAVLAGVFKHRIRGCRCGLVNVGIRKNYIRALASEFECHTFDLVGCSSHDALAHLGRAREYNLANIRVRDEPFADNASLSGENLEQPVGQASFTTELGESEARQRRPFGRLEDDGISRGERRNEPP